MAHAKLEPFGGPVEDYRAGLIAASIVNANLAPNTDPVNVYTFFPWHQPPPPPPQTPEEITDRLRAMLNAKAKAAAKKDADGSK